ncbi:MAG: bifunctional adenosylcobinamide kinase/adenosylcobinamide-phosphate guanylyltransferase [Pseudomonadota bacterium]
MRQLFLGGVRSGKSALAEAAASACAAPVTYIATAQALDTSMQARIDTHKARRPESWALIEEPLALAEVVQQHSGEHRCLLIDCLTLWLSNIMFADEYNARDAIARLESALSSARGHIILVSSEVGLGVMPDNALAREYADLLGELNQRVAARCERVTMAVAGLPNVLKSGETKA